MTTLRNILIGLMILISARLSAEPIGDIISYQGKLTNPDGTPVANGTQSVTFQFYELDAKLGAAQSMQVQTLGGVFAAFLNVQGMAFDPTKEYWLGITFNGSETKQKIASVPVAQGVGVNGVVTDSIKDGAVTQEKAPWAPFICQPDGPAPGRKMVVCNWVFTTTGGNKSETFTPDISGAGLTERPLAGALTVACCNIGTVNVGYNWDASTPTQAAITIATVNGSNIAAGALFRITGVLIGR